MPKKNKKKENMWEKFKLLCEALLVIVGLATIFGWKVEQPYFQADLILAVFIIIIYIYLDSRIKNLGG